MTPARRWERTWSGDGWASRLLVPLSLLFSATVRVRRRLYRLGWFRTTRLPIPVIVVGNVTVGGTGKTPLVLWIAQRLQRQGWRPGIVTRGYGGRARCWPQRVLPETDARLVGDEPVLLARRSACPVIADPDRPRGAAGLQTLGCDIVVADDGLQHYRLARDLEIAVIDGDRRFGNGRCLPAGPLREPLARLESVDARVVQGEPKAGEWGMTLQPTAFHRVGGEEHRAPAAFRDETVHAVAGIGNPGRFFAHLRALGIRVIEHPFPDHHPFVPGDLRFGDARPVVMTEKDAVKCSRFPLDNAWYLAVSAAPDPRFAEWLDNRLTELRRG